MEIQIFLSGKLLMVRKTESGLNTNLVELKNKNISNCIDANYMP